MSRFSSWLGADLRYALKNTAIAVGFLAAANACGGGGCASSCAGSSVIPGGFPKDKRVENAAGVRLTRPGLDFLEKNLGPVLTKVLGMSASGGVLTFPINESSGKVLSIFSYTICPGGPDPKAMPPKCVVEINVANVKNIKINADKPNDLLVNATIPVRLRNLPVKAIGINMTAGLTKGAASMCDSGEYVDVPVTATISLETVPDDAKHAVRAGYTKINIKALSFDQKTLEDNFKFCGSGIGTDILNALKGLIIGSVIGGLTGNLTGPLADATCMTPQKLPDGTDQCPTGTFNRAGKCRFEDKDDGECVPMLLGLESRFDLSGLLASLSPGTSGGLDFMLASGGNMEPAPSTTTAENGATLHMLGGGQPFPISQCVPAVDNPIPTGIQLPDELFKNSVDGWTAPTPPHLGIGLAERFLNHAATGAYNSGLFCIGISSEQVAQLNAGLFSLLLRSIDGLADKFKASDSSPAMALAIRPQKPPAITIGDNDFAKTPLLDLKLQDTDLDFYMWSHERFIRLFTGRIDIEVPINMEAGADGLALKFAPKNPLSFTNPRISNNNLLLEDDKQVGNLVQSIGGLIPASTFSSIKPFKLDSALASLGLKLTIPEGGIRKVEKGTDRFLGIFAYLEVAGAAIPKTMTSARIVSQNIDPKNFKLETVGTAPPSFEVHASALEDNGSKKVEYAYKVDNGPYSVFMPERDFTVTSPFFILQGKHTISVVSRIAGAVESESEPVTLPVLIDVLAPQVKIESKTAGVANIIAGDLVSHGNDLKVEARVDGGAWIPVMADDKGTRTVKVAPESAQLEVRATDEAGNVGTSSAALIRGRADQLAPGGSGCGCSVPGNDTTPTGLAAFGALAAIGAVIERRRRRSRARDLAAASIVPLAFGVAGCSCGASGDDGTGGPAACNGKSDLTSFVIGSHTSVATAADGTIWVAGYNEGDPSGGSTEDFQADLVVGKYDSGESRVKWQIIDGYPKPDANTQLDHNNCGWREGVTDPGDDVGQFTAMQLDGQNNPVVAYFDRTNGALKVARFDGSSWSTHQVDAQATGWAGKHNAMVMLDGKPVIAYQSIEAGTGGFAKAKIRVAKAQTASPSSSSDWSIEDAIVEEKNPCMQAICGAGQKCLVGVADTFDPVCTATTGGCMPACASDTEACVKDKMGVAGCQKTKPTLGIYANALGESISLATSGSDLVLVAYDRWHGNLRSATNKGGTWKSTPPDAPLDGWTGDAAKDKGTGDRGFGASLAVDSTGNWHVVYADGIKEWLLYRFVPGGDVSKAAAPVVVDDGATTDGMTKFTDGQHVIGDTSWIMLDGSNVKIVYQDTTAGTLRWAKGAGGPMAKFTRGVIKQDGFAGFWPRFAGSQVLNFFRQRGLTEEGGDKVIIGDVRAVTIP